MFTTILLDIDNTLLDFNKNSALAMRVAFSNNGLEFKDSYSKVFLSVNDRLWAQFERGEIDRAGIYAVRYDLILSELGLNGDSQKIECDYRKILSESVEKVDGADDLLSYLGGKYTLCAASNASKKIQINRLYKAGFLHYFTYLFISEEMGVSKPSKEYFLKCIEKLSPIKKEEIIMIGDSLTADIAGAKNVGIKSIYYNHNKNPLPEKQLYDYSVNSLEEIKNIL